MHYKLKLTFTSPLLGSSPSSPTVYTDYIAAKAEGAMNGDAAEEVNTLRKRTAREEEDETVKRTVFHRDELGRPCIYNYVLKGFFKAACSASKNRDDIKPVSGSLRNHKTHINNLVVVKPRLLTIRLVKPTAVLERPLRAETAQGPRVALAASEVVEAGASIECQVIILSDKMISEEMLREWLSFGEFQGLGQWRSGDWGQFTYELTPIVGV